MQQAVICTFRQRMLGSYPEIRQRRCQEAKREPSWHAGLDQNEKTRQSAVQLIAKDLVKLYAARQEQKVFVYGEDTVWHREFEEMFPFEETEDQMLAIDAVKQDRRALRSWIV